MTIDLSYVNTDNVTWVDRKIENGVMRAEPVDFDRDITNQTAQKLAQASKTWPENKDKIKEVFNKRKKSWVLPHENGDFLTPIQSKLL